MPIYEYICDKCQNEFEVLVRGQEKPECPQCGGRKLDKKLSTVAAHTHAALPLCPAKESGACGMGGCGGGACGMGNFG